MRELNPPCPAKCPECKGPCRWRMAMHKDYPGTPHVCEVNKHDWGP